MRVRTLEVTKPYKFIWFGAMDVTKPHKFITFGTMDVQHICTFMMGPPGPVRQGPRGGGQQYIHMYVEPGDPVRLYAKDPGWLNNIYTFIWGPGGPVRQGSRGCQQHIHINVRPKGPRTPGCQHKWHTYVGLRAPVCQGPREAYARIPNR
jgi:hypothetical protein